MRVVSLFGVKEGVSGSNIHGCEAEDEGDREALSNGVIGRTVGTRQAHDKCHIQRHEETSNPEGLLTTPAVNVVETHQVCERTNKAVYTVA